ncbi:hypothetical protein KR009_003543 [Drosophila setifemur]|nr:hypothetical protein KR009_003543 [Drosophila setifemur]
MKWIGHRFSQYTLLLGMSSYFVTNLEFRQTRTTQTYALVLNALTLTLLPVAFWNLAKIMTLANWLPKFMWIAPYVLCSVNYIVIAYTLISRCYRDRMLMDLQIVLAQLRREVPRKGKKMPSKLQRLFLLKSFTVFYLCLAYLLSPFVYYGLQPWEYILNGVLINIAYNILVASTYFYFVCFWQIVRGYDFVNQQLEDIASSSTISSADLAEEIRNLHALHANLRRTALRINRHYGPQMLASRFDYFMFSIIYGYMGVIYSKYEKNPSVEKYYGALIYWVRSFDFFLNDYICDMVDRYQSKSKFININGSLSKEMSSYLIYENSMRLHLRVCGLYAANKSKWLQMVGSIIVHSVMLLQFHIVMSK